MCDENSEECKMCEKRDDCKKAHEFPKMQDKDEQLMMQAKAKSVIDSSDFFFLIAFDEEGPEVMSCLPSNSIVWTPRISGMVLHHARQAVSEGLKQFLHSMVKDGVPPAIAAKVMHKVLDQIKHEADNPSTEPEDN